MSARGLPAEFGKFAGVHTHTNGGPPAEAPGGPCTPCGPCGPWGPSIFHSTKLSFAWQAALESTSRIIPFPEFTQAFSTPDPPAETLGTSTIKSTTATIVTQAITTLRLTATFIAHFSSGGENRLHKLKN